MSENLDAYAHPEHPYALVAYSSSSQGLASALCLDLLAHGFQLAAISLEGEDHKNVRDALGNKTAGEVSYISLQAGDPEGGLQALSKLLHSQDATLSISCVDSSWWSRTGADDEKKLKFSGQAYESQQLFVGVQRVVLPHLIKNSPAALLIISDTCIPELDPSKASLSKFLESFTYALSREVKGLGHEDVNVAHMNYYRKESTDQSTSDSGAAVPATSTLASSILRASARDALHITPLWSHVILAWIVWLLLWILPQSTVRRLVL